MLGEQTPYIKRNGYTFSFWNILMSLERQNKFPRRELRAKTGLSRGHPHQRAPWSRAEAGALFYILCFRWVLFHYVVHSGLPRLTQGDLVGQPGWVRCHLRTNTDGSAGLCQRDWKHVSPMTRGFSVGSASSQVDFANWEDYRLDPETIAPWFVSLMYLLEKRRCRAQRGKRQATPLSVPVVSGSSHVILDKIFYPSFGFCNSKMRIIKKNYSAPVIAFTVCSLLFPVLYKHQLMTAVRDATLPALKLIMPPQGFGGWRKK